jgi:hypothetical protein
MTDVNIPQNKVDEFIAKFEKLLAILLEGGLAKECPVDNGGLRNSIDVSVVEGQLIIKMLDYGVHVEYGCFFNNNIKILTDKGQKSLKSLKKGDLIWNGYEYRPLIQKQEYEVLKQINQIEIETKNGILKVTEDHPFLTTNGWKNAIDLKKSDRLISIW